MRTSPIVCFGIMSFVLLGVYFGYTSGVYAQTSLNSVSVNVTPKIPGAHQGVSFELKSFSVDLERSQIEWAVDGKIVLSGLGKKKFSTQTGAIGSTVKISVTVTTQTLEKIERIILLQPSEVDLLIESADGYAPPFYEGRTVPTTESTVRAVAIPSVKNAKGTTLKPSDFVYTWKRDDKTISNASGYSKDAFVFKRNYLRPNESISLNATAVDDGYAAEKRFSLLSVKPKVVLYENDPLLGIRYASAIGSSLDLGSEEKSVIAIPYFFSAQGLIDTVLAFDWKLGGQPVPSGSDKKYMLNLRAGGTKGTTSMSLSVKNKKKLFESAANNAMINLK